MPPFTSINFYQNRPKIKLLFAKKKKYKTFERWGTESVSLRETHSLKRILVFVLILKPIHKIVR